MTGLLRAVRKQRGLTLAILAEQTGLTKSYLSKIERQRSTPSIAVALKVARALDVDVAQLFSDKSADEMIVIDRADDRSGNAGHYRLLAPSLLGKAMSPLSYGPLMAPTIRFRPTRVKNSCSCTREQLNSSMAATPSPWPKAIAPTSTHRSAITSGQWTRRAPR
jgi:transcriptional regulator with XRE-family HTH domain